MGHYPLEPFRTRFEKISTDILPIDVPCFFLLFETGNALLRDRESPGFSRGEKVNDRYGMFQLPWSRTVEEKTTPNNLGWPV